MPIQQTYHNEVIIEMGLYCLSFRYKTYLRVTNSYIMKFFLSLVFCFCCLQMFAQNSDINLLKEINVNRNQKLDKTFEVITESHYVVSVLTPLTFLTSGILKKDKHLIEKGFSIGGSLAVNLATTLVLKKVVDRQRPYQTYPFIDAYKNEKSQSFPSGHTSNAFCTATALSLNCKKWYVIAPSYIWASAVGYSRMHLGVHYPSDILGGAVVGAGSALITHKLNQYLRKRYLKKKPQGYLIWFP